MNKSKKILVTGGAGFIASHIVDAHINNGDEVLVVDNLSSGNTKNINKKAEFIKLDINDKAGVLKAIQDFKPQIINHHAAHILVGNSVNNPQFDATVNILGFLNIMEAAKNLKVEKVIMASTGGAIYGDKQTPFDESMREQPLSPYGISKKSAELYLHYYYTQYGISYTVLRYANVYGPRQNAHGESGVIAVFSDLINKDIQPTINGDGLHTRDYVFVADVVKANMLAVESNYCGELNIGTNTEVTTNYVFQKIVKEFGKQMKELHGSDRPGEQVTSSLSYKKATKVLGWEPEVNFNDGIKQTITWYSRNNK